MRQIRPDRRTASGVTLLEMTVAMVLVAIVAGAAIFFTLPVQQAGDVVVRAALTDMADNALQRIGRDVRLALPNSVRVRQSGGAWYLEFIPVRTGGRYRVANSGLCNGAGSDALTFDAADTCFKSLGPIPNFAEVVTGSDFLVLNNYGPNFTGQNVYDVPPANLPYIASLTSSEVRFASFNFDRKLHDSPGRRFFIAAPPVSYRCDPGLGTLTRHTGYTLNATQPDSLPAGVALATSVSDCTFQYSDSVAPFVALLSLRLTLQRAVSTGTERVSLYHAIHVNNLP